METAISAPKILKICIEDMLENIDEFFLVLTTPTSDTNEQKTQKKQKTEHYGIGKEVETNLTKKKKNFVNRKFIVDEKAKFKKCLREYHIPNENKKNKVVTKSGWLQSFSVFNLPANSKDSNSAQSLFGWKNRRKEKNRSSSYWNSVFTEPTKNLVFGF